MFNLNDIKKRNICIMGLMGSGKSIIGKDLSKNLNLKFYDTDKQIELKTKKSINAIFAEEGESYFRTIEEDTCLDLLANHNCDKISAINKATDELQKKFTVEKNNLSAMYEQKIKDSLALEIIRIQQF